MCLGVSALYYSPLRDNSHKVKMKADASLSLLGVITIEMSLSLSRLHGLNIKARSHYAIAKTKSQIIGFC